VLCRQKKPRRRVLPHQRVNTEFIRTSLEGRAVAVREVWTQACTLLCQRERCRYAGPHGGHDSSLPPRETHTMYHWLRNLGRTRPPRRAKSNAPAGHLTVQRAAPASCAGFPADAHLEPLNIGCQTLNLRQHHPEGIYAIVPTAAPTSDGTWSCASLPLT
jgi:hypothetical protein